MSRIVMDEIEFKQLYNHTCDMIDKLTDPDTKRVALCCLQMLWDIHARLIDMQLEEDDEE